MSSLETAVLVAATGLTGLGAGIFVAFAVTIMPALKHVNDTAFVATFQSINRVIINPWFMATFLGGPLVTAVSLGLHWGDRDGQFGLIALGLVANVVNLAITMGGNVPLNDGLDRAGAVAGAEATAARQVFEAPWNRLHNIRTVVWVAGFVALVVACVNG